MRGFEIGLLSTTALVLALGTSAAFSGDATGINDATRPIRIAANPCRANPCAAKNPCSPGAAKNPCNPCAAASPCAPTNPCNPCAAAVAATPCVVPRLVAAAPARNPCAAAKSCGPCAARNPCNPCAAKSPCNPCAAKSPCNPCAAENPCSPCAAASPCNPCAAAADAEPPELAEAELIAAYDCVTPYLDAAYIFSGRDVSSAYRGWARFSRTAYPAEAHGIRFMNNYANAVAAETYGKWEGLGAMPVGSVLAKDSFIVADDGKISVGPLFVMEKRVAGYSAEARDWYYEMIMPGGVVKGDASIQEFCNGCHRRAGDADDYLMFMPDEYRVGKSSG